MDIFQNNIENPRFLDETVPILVILSALIFKLIQLIASGGKNLYLHSLLIYMYFAFN